MEPSISMDTRVWSMLQNSTLVSKMNQTKQKWPPYLPYQLSPPPTNHLFMVAPRRPHLHFNFWTRTRRNGDLWLWSPPWVMYPPKAQLTWSPAQLPSHCWEQHSRYFSHARTRTFNKSYPPTIHHLYVLSIYYICIVVNWWFNSIMFAFGRCPECDGAGFVRKSGVTLRANAARKDQTQIVCARCDGLGKLNQVDK